MVTRILGTFSDLTDESTIDLLTIYATASHEEVEQDHRDKLAAEFRDTIRLFLPVGHALRGDEFVGIGIADDEVEAATTTVKKAIAEAVEHLPAIARLHW